MRGKRKKKPEAIQARDDREDIQHEDTNSTTDLGRENKNLNIRLYCRCLLVTGLLTGQGAGGDVYAKHGR